MRVLVTGAFGIVGRPTIEALRVRRPDRRTGRARLTEGSASGTMMVAACAGALEP